MPIVKCINVVSFVLSFAMVCTLFAGVNVVAFAGKVFKTNAITVVDEGVALMDDVNIADYTDVNVNLWYNS